MDFDSEKLKIQSKEDKCVKGKQFSKDSQACKPGWVEFHARLFIQVSILPSDHLGN